jgi:hypothetical protein
MIPTPQPLSLRQKTMVLCGSLQFLAPWPIACGALLVGLWAWAWSTIHHEKDEIRQRAYITAAAQAHTYAEQIERMIGQLDYIMLSLQFQWQKNGGKLNLEEQVNAGLVPKNTQIAISVFDPRGIPVTTTSPEIRSKPGIASRDYFKKHANDSSKELAISKPMRSIIFERDVLIFSRRLDTPDRAFAGVMVLAVEPAFLASFADETKIGKDDFVSIRSADGGFIASKTKQGLRTHEPNLRGVPAFDRPSGVRVTPAERYLDRRLEYRAELPDHGGRRHFRERFAGRVRAESARNRIDRSHGQPGAVPDRGSRHAPCAAPHPADAVRPRSARCLPHRYRECQGWLLHAARCVPRAK